MALEHPLRCLNLQLSSETANLCTRSSLRGWNFITSLPRGNVYFPSSTLARNLTRVDVNNLIKKPANCRN